jgi:protein TonB
MQDLYEHRKLWEDAMFEDATFHSKGLIHDKTPQWMLFALALNISLLTLLLLRPLIYPDSLPLRTLSRMLYTPPPAVHLTRQVIRSSARAVPLTLSLRDPFAAPRHPPTGIDTRPDDGPPPTTADMISSDGSVMGADGPASVFHATPLPQVHPAPAQKLRISDLTAGRLAVNKVLPAYPAIARAAGISGTVVLAATISRTGTIENLRVVSGPEMLRQSALDAVKQWSYKPYLLNGQPVEVETTVNVVFSLNGR